MTPVDAIYQKYISVFYEIDGGGAWIDLAAVRYALRAALRELAAAQPAVDIIVEHRHLDAIVRRIERVLEAHDSDVFADLVAGNIELPTAIDAVIDSHKSALAAVAADTQRSNARLEQLNRINEWIISYAGDAYDDTTDDGDTADAMIAAADRLRGQVDRLQAMLAAGDAAARAASDGARILRHDLATAIAERDESDSLLAKLADWLDTHPVDDGDGNEVDTAIKLLEFQAAEVDALRGQVAKLRVEVGDLRLTVSQLHEHRRANQPLITEVNALRQQLAQMDADNARLTQELRTVRSWSVAPTGNGKSHPAAILTAAQSADETPAPWNDAMLTGLDAETADYWHGIAAGRWTWRKLPKSTRLAMVRHVLSFTNDGHHMTMSEFDAIKPTWMPTANSHPITFGVSWSELADPKIELAYEKTVPA